MEGIGKRAALPARKKRRGIEDIGEAAEFGLRNLIVPKRKVRALRTCERFFKNRPVPLRIDLLRFEIHAHKAFVRGKRIKIPGLADCIAHGDRGEIDAFARSVLQSAGREEIHLSVKRARDKSPAVHRFKERDVGAVRRRKNTALHKLVISHELKTPMTSIAGYTDGILDGTIPLKDERRYLQIISDESHRLSRLVRRMLDISQIQSQEMHKEDFDLCESMRIALLSMEQKINQRGLDVEADIPEDSVMVRGDNELITQVIYNLLENATKYAADHSTLYLGLACRGEKAVVTVRNTGNTIPAQEIPLLFERFHKSDKSRSVDKDGYGLGLYVVKTILNQHKEQITVTSENGVTAFSFTVQMADSTRSYG